jgi:lysophospholipase L1-like esterase
MMRRLTNRFARLLPVVALVVVSLIGLVQSTTVAASQHEYVALGDSIAAGLLTSLPRDRGYPALVSGWLQKQDASEAPPTALNFVNLAVPGETDESFVAANGQLQRFQTEVSSVKARGADIQLVTLTLGGNDILQLQNLGNADRQAGLDRFRASFPAAVNGVMQALGDLKPTVVLTTYYDLSGGDPQVTNSDAWWVAQFNDVIKSTAQQHGLKVADLEPAFRGHIQDWTWYPVDVHPNNDGHAEIAQLVWQASGLDQTAPVVQITKPASGQLSRSIATISAKVTDNVGVNDVQLWVNGKQVSSLIFEPSLNEYVGLWDGTDATSSQVTLSIHASDEAGHVTSADVTVTLPNSQGGG